MNEKDHSKILRSRNIQPTAMRLRVFQYLVQQKTAVSLSALEEYFTRSDRTTLYRSLKKFEEHGLVHRIDDAGGSTKYALCPKDCTCTYPDDTHIHFFCTDCESTYCLTELTVPDITLPEQFHPESGNFVISGHCTYCTS